MSELVRLTALPRPFSMARQILEVPPGLSLEEMFALAQPNQMLRGYASIFIGDERIAPEYWPAVRPKPGTEVTIRVLPAGGDGDKDALSILLTIVVIVASIFLPILLPATAFTVAGVAVSYGAIAAAGVGLLAGLAQTALASPPRQPRANNISGLPQSSPTQSITGTRNRASLFGVEPRVFGRTRIFPLFAALPFSEWNGDVQYFTTLFEVGYGPLELSDFRIGETPLAQYQDVEIEIREGRATDEPLTLYRNQVREDAFSVTITQAGGALIRETQVNADEFSLDLAWPRGLIWLPSDQAGINASGPQAPLSVDVKIEYRTAGSADPWTAAPNLINTVEYDTTAVTETSAPAGKKYVDYKTDNLIKGVVCAGLTCPATLTTSSGTATLHGIKYRVYSRFEGSTEWKLQIDMEDYLEAGNSQTVELIGTQATKMEVRIERKAVAYNDTDTEPAANGGGYNAIPAPASWTYQGQSITDGTFTFTAEQHELLRRTILVRPAAQGKFEIRITRITLDIVKEGQDEFELAAIRTVTWASPLNVTGRALIALRIRATDQLHGMLDEVNCIGQAILPIYDKVGQTWSEAPTRNPAWARLEVLRGGAIGVTIADSRIDLDGHADFAALCDVAAPQSSLPDAINSDETEPHFTFDGVFDFDTTVFDTLRDIDATARAAHTMVDGKFSIVVDQAQSVPVAMITTKNSFGFRGTLVLSALPHALHVKFRDEARGFKDRTITVYADGYTALNATEFQDVEMFGVQRAAQAWRGGRYLLAHGNLRREVIEVSQDVENIVVTRGDLVELQHDVPRYGGESGRVKSVTVNGGGAATSMDVDEALQMTGGNSYAVRWRQSDSDQFEHAIDTATGGVTTVTFTTPVPAAEIPAIGDLFAFGEFDSVTERMLVHSIRHAGELRARLRLISEAPGVHTADQSALPILETTFNDDPMVSPPPVVEDLAATEVEILFGGDYRYDAHYTWRMPATGFAGAFEVYREIAGVFQLVDVIRQASYSFQNLAVGDTVKAAVVSVGPSGHKLGLSLAPSVVHTVIGSPPQDVLDFAGEVIGDKMRLSWMVRSTTRASHYRLRFTPKLVAAVWGDGADLGVPVPWPTAAVEVPARSGTYLIKAVDSNGVLSVNAKSVITTVPDALDLNVVSTLTEHPAFAGTHSYTAVVGGKVRLGSATAIGDWPDMSAITNMEYGPDGLALTGTYTLSGDFDLGDVYVSRITGAVLTTGINIEDSVGSWPDMSLIDDMGGSVNANHSVRLEIRTTEDNPAGAPVWTAWQTLVAGDYKARAGEFRAVMTTDDSAVTPEIEEITITVDMPDRIIAGKDLVTLTGSALTVAFSPALYALASNDVTVKDMASGDRLVITNETVNGFDAEVRDSGGSRVVRTFNHLTKGHGRIAA